MASLRDRDKQLNGRIVNKNAGKDETGTNVPGSDFIILEAPKLQANVVVFGDAGMGKTTFCTDFCPGPVAFINFDRRADQAIYKAIKYKGKKIYLLRVHVPANLLKVSDVEAKKAGQEAVKRVIKNFEWAVEQSKLGKIRTIVLDTGTELSEILNLALTGKMEGVKNDFGKSKDLANREWWRLFNMAREGNAHFVVLARAQEIWVGNEPTGRFKPRGHAVMLDAADWVGQTRLKRKSGRRSSGSKEFELEITKAGVNIDELGAVYTEEEWGDDGPFVHACFMQFIETSEPENWK